MFTAGGPVSIPSGGCVDFEVCRADADCFSESYGSILIRRPGLYYAALTVDIPKNTCVDTVMSLALDGEAAPLAELPVATAEDGCTSNFAAHAVFHAAPGALLKLRTHDGLCIPCAARPVFTLTILSAGPTADCCRSAGPTANSCRV